MPVYMPTENTKYYGATGPGVMTVDADEKLKLTAQLALARGGTAADLSAAVAGGMVYGTGTALAATAALTGIMQANTAAAPTAITGTANYIPKWSAAAPYLTGTSQIFDSGTYVGIGTAVSPSHLQIAGNLSAAAWTTTGIAFDVAAATFTDTSTAGAGTVAVRAANSLGAPTFASTNAITVTDAFTLYVPKPIVGTNTTITRANSAYFEGHVGIGTLAPAKRIDSLDASAAQLRLTHTAATVYTDFQTNSGGNLVITPSGGSVCINKIIGGTATTADLYLQTTGGVGAAGADMHFLVGNNGATEAMTILNSGYVGIGTTTPAANLDVNNTTTRTITVAANDRILHVQGALTEAASGVHARIMGVEIDPPTITAGVATVTNTATVYISAAPTCTVTGANFSLWIAAGAVRCDDNATFGAHATNKAVIGVTGGGTAYCGASIGGWSFGLTSDNGTTFPISWDGNRTVTIDGGNLSRTIVSTSLGVGTTAPAKRLESLDASAAQLRLTHTATTVYTDFQTTSLGHLSITGSGGFVGVGGAPTSHLQVSGNISAAAWTTTGIAFDVAAATFTDTSTAALGTVAVRAANSLGAPTFASTNAITVTDAFTLYVPKPIAGTNTTITRANSAYFEGNVGIGTTSPYAKLEVGTPYGSYTFPGVIFNSSGVPGLPQTTGTNQVSGVLRLGNYNSAASIDFGTNGANAAWIQVVNVNGLGSCFGLVLNPNGGNVGIGQTVPIANLDINNTTTRTITVAANDRILHVQGALTEAASGVHARIMGVEIDPPTITAGVATCTNTATVYISAAPTCTVTGGNYSLWIAAGNINLGALDVVLDTTTGTKIGTAAAQKLALWGAVPVVQRAHIIDADGNLADITTKFNTLLGHLETIGVLAAA